MSRLLKALFWAAGFCLVAWAWHDPRFRDADGLLTAQFCLWFAVSAALALLGSLWGSRYRPAAFWFCLALVGQAAALQLVEAGTQIRYQHYKPIARLAREAHPALLGLLAAQTILVAAALGRKWRPWRDWTRAHLKAWQLVLLGLLFVASSAAPSRDPARYVEELLVAALIQALSLATVALMAAAIPADALGRVRAKLGSLLLEQSDGTGASLPVYRNRLVLAAAAWVLVLASLLNILVYQRHPHVADEVVYLYHARYLAAGMLAMAPPPVPAAFDLDLMQVESDRWYCPVPPGWPAMLALGVLAGAPWLVNPVLAALNVLLSYKLLQSLCGSSTARLSALLLAVSPWHVFMAMNFMTHTFTLTCALVAALAVVRARATRRIPWGAVAGAATSMVFLIRPLEGLAVGLLLGLWVLGVGGQRLSLPAMTAFAAAAVGVAALVLPYNKALTGQAGVFPVMAYMDKHHGRNSNALGFGPDRGMGWALDPYPGHGLKDAIVNAALNTSSLNVELFGWGAGSVALAALGLLAGTRARGDYPLLAVAAAIFVIHIFYWFSGGPDFGARYWFLMLLPGIVLTARGAQWLALALDTRVAVALLSLSLAAMVNFFPWRALDKYRHYLGMRPDVLRLAAQHRFGRSLVLVRGERFPDYMSAAVYNPLDLRSPVPIYAWDRNPEVRRQLLETYADRPVWVLDGPSITRKGFQITSGSWGDQALLRAN